jgi:hydrogenase maturation protease
MNGGVSHLGGERAKRVLVLGYGNPGRQDDGLGPAAAIALDGLRLPNVDAFDNYQLNIEDAIEVADHDEVWFVDAARSGPPIAVTPLSPSPTVDFTSHIVRPQTILAIAARCWERAPPAFLLAIRGYDFEFLEALTPGARGNLRLAMAMLTARLGTAAAPARSAAAP